MSSDHKSEQFIDNFRGVDAWDQVGKWLEARGIEDIDCIRTRYGGHTAR